MKCPIYIMFPSTEVAAINGADQQCYGIAGNSYCILLSGTQTNGAYAVIDMHVSPGGGPGPHAHKDMQEMFFVVDGEVEFQSENGKHIARKGDLVNIPFGGAVHAFKNKTELPARLLCTVIPAGLDDFFRQIGEPIEAGVFPERKAPTPEAMERIRQLGLSFGQDFFPPDYFEKGR